MSDTPIPYKRDSSAASVSAGDVYRVGLLIKHAANCECCRNAMIEGKENNNEETKGRLAHQASQQQQTANLSRNHSKQDGQDEYSQLR